MPRRSSQFFPTRSKAREGAARLFSILSNEIKGAGGRSEALLNSFQRDQGRGRTPRRSSHFFITRSRAREDTAALFSILSNEIKGAGGHRGALLNSFQRDQGRGRTPRRSSQFFPTRSRAREDTAALFSLLYNEIKGAGGRGIPIPRD